VREGLGHRDGAKRRAGAGVHWELRPYERSRCTEHIGTLARVVEIEYRARSTGEGHGRTPDACEQRFNGVNLRETLEVG
jgi:hypothetical protein